MWERAGTIVWTETLDATKISPDDDMRRSDLGTSINITYKPVDPLIASVVQVDPHHCLMCLIIGFSCHDGRCEDDLRGWKEGPFCDGCFRYNQYETHKVLMSYCTNDSGLGLNASVPPRVHDGSTQRSLLTLRLCSEEEKLVVPGPTLGLFIVIIRLSLYRVCWETKLDSVHPSMAFKIINYFFLSWRFDGDEQLITYRIYVMRDPFTGQP